MKKQLVIVGLITLIVCVGFSGCNTSSKYDLNDFKVTLDNINVHSGNYVGISFNLKINNYQRKYQTESFIVGSLNYVLTGNGHYFTGGKITDSYEVGPDLITFNDFIYFDNLTIDSQLINNFSNKQPIRWTVSGELTLYGKNNTPILISFDGLTYYMTEYD
jgi:hypothetical protein